METDAAAMCYTSGTTGNPKGVVYSHRSMYLHSMAVAMGDAMGLTPYDRILPIVPMFHANAWGLPYAAIMVGAALVMPDRWLQPEPLTRLIAAEQGDGVGRRADDLERHPHLRRREPAPTCRRSGWCRAAAPRSRSACSRRCASGTAWSSSRRGA